MLWSLKSPKKNNIFYLVFLSPHKSTSEALENTADFMFCVCLPGPSWGLHMDYTPGTLCPAWTPCRQAEGTPPSQITRPLSWKWRHTNRKKQCHTQTSVLFGDIRRVSFLADTFTLRLVIVKTVWSRDILRDQSAMQSSFQRSKLQTLGCNVTESRKLHLNLLHTSWGAEQAPTLLLFGTYAWKLNLFPWQWQNPMACSAASVAMTTAH